MTNTGTFFHTFLDFEAILGSREGPKKFRKILKIIQEGFLERPERQRNRKNRVSEGGPVLDPVLGPVLEGF